MEKVRIIWMKDTGGSLFAEKTVHTENIIIFPLSLCCSLWTSFLHCIWHMHLHRFSMLYLNMHKNKNVHLKLHLNMNKNTFAKKCRFGLALSFSSLIDSILRRHEVDGGLLCWGEGASASSVRSPSGHRDYKGTALNSTTAVATHQQCRDS